MGFLREAGWAAAGAAATWMMLRTNRGSSCDEAEDVVRRFLAAQDERDLDAMCSLVAKDVLYINEPHGEERHIRSRAEFREAFARSPCIWAEKANLQVLRLVSAGGVVFVERRDQFLIDGKWLTIPICGYLVVHAGEVALWHDYWDSGKYREQTARLFGPAFSLFRSTKERAAGRAAL